MALEPAYSTGPSRRSPWQGLVLLPRRRTDGRPEPDRVQALHGAAPLPSQCALLSRSWLIGLGKATYIEYRDAPLT